MTFDNTTIDAIRKEWTEGQLDSMRLYRAYYEGEQNPMMTPAQRRALYPQKLNAQADNILRLVLTTIASRIRFESWEVQEPRPEAGDTSADQLADEQAVGPVTAYTADVYMRNKLPKLNHDLVIAQLRDGNTALSVGWRNGRARIFRERWWDGEDGVFVGYDRYGDEEFAVREWSERLATGALQKRRTVYYPDHYVRYWMDGVGWRPIVDAPEQQPTDEEGTVIATDARPLSDGSIPWEKKPGDPLGLPIVHFPNGSRHDSPYGSSDLTGLLGLQDEINSIQHDIAGAAKFTGFQMMWTRGGSRDGTPLRIGPGRLLEFPSDMSGGAPAGVLPAGDMSALTNAHEYKRGTIAINSQTPMHQITGAEWPSGEAILQTQIPLEDKTTRLIEINGPLMMLLGHRCTELANVFGRMSPPLDETAPLTAVFASPRRLDELTEVRIMNEKAKLMQVVSTIGDEVLLRKLDFLTVEDVDELIANRSGMTMDPARQEVVDEEAIAALDAAMAGTTY